MKLSVFTDGGSLGNPGPSAIGFVVYLNKKIVEEFSLYIGYSTNNQAEYTALIAALQSVKKHINKDVKEIIFYSDSKLMVNQINGYYKIKSQPIRKLFLEVQKKLLVIKTPIKFIHILREKNRLADSLVKKAFSNR